MKFKNTGGKFIIFASIILMFFLTTFCVSAVGEEDVQDNTAVPVTESEQVIETPAQVVVTTQAVATTQAVTEAATPAPTYAATRSVTEAPARTTYATAQVVTSSLPPAETEPDPTAVMVTQGDDGDMTYGLVSWACVIVGVLTVIVVIISNKSHYNGGSGKQRYDEGNKITGQKRLLNDDYYNNRKYNSYYDKDTRR